MIAQDYDDFCQVVIGFAELKGKSLSPAAIELYWRAMQHWDIDDFKLAAEQLLRTSDWMPTPKEFEDLRKAGRPTAGEAFARILDAARKGNAPPDDPVTVSALSAVGGIRAIAMSDTDKTHFLEKRFCDHFESIQDATDVRIAVPQIASPEYNKRLAAPVSAQSLLSRFTPPPKDETREDKAG